MFHTRNLLALVLAGPLLASPLPAHGQGMEMKSPPGDRQRGRDLPRPLDRDLDPQRPHVPHAPGFIEPLTRPTETGRAGMAGWIAPSTPTGSRAASPPEGSSGWLGFGFAIEWGGPSRTPARGGDASH